VQHADSDGPKRDESVKHDRITAVKFDQVSTVANPFSTQIYYPDGDPENMREVSTSGWTGKFFYIHRDYWNNAVAEYRDQLQKPGVYVLAGDDDFESGDDLQKIYIGHANNLHKRIDQHIKNPEKGFFQSVVLVVENSAFTSTHFKWMESYLIEKAVEINRCDLDNENTPNKPHVPKAEEANIKNFLEKAYQMFPIVEIKAFTKPKTIRQDATEKPDVEKKTEGTLGLRDKVLVAFESRENVKLLKRSRATFYDDSKTTCVGCYTSKLYVRKQKFVWFAPSKKVVDFLEDATQGYLVFGMEKQTNAIAIPINEFSKIKNELNPKYDKDKNEILWWHMKIFITKGNFELRLKGRKRLDLSQYAFDLK